jgi:hypothetical protein
MIGTSRFVEIVVAFQPAILILIEDIDTYKVGIEQMIDDDVIRQADFCILIILPP